MHGPTAAAPNRLPIIQLSFSYIAALAAPQPRQITHRISARMYYVLQIVKRPCGYPPNRHRVHNHPHAPYPSTYPHQSHIHISQSVITRIQTRDDRPRREISGSCCPVQTSSKFKLVRFIRQKSFPMCAEAGGGGGFSSCRSVREIYQSRSQLSRQHGRGQGAATPQCFST